MTTELIRPAEKNDASRIAEILVFNNRVNFFPIFGDEKYSFGEMQVLTVAEEYLKNEKKLGSTFVYDDGVVRGFVQVEENEIKKLYVDTFFQNNGVGAALIDFAVNQKHALFLWALEKNTRAIKFYEKHGFTMSGEKTFEEGTDEYLVRMARTL
ncbi:MAG: GNAT family N-acetyltransferase [Eubacteriales bacterium]